MLAVFRSAPWALVVMCCAGLLQAASAMAFGNANITPGHLSTAFFALAVLIRPDPFKYAMPSLQQFRPGMILLALSAWAIISGILLPRLFAGDFLVFSLNGVNGKILPAPLLPNGSNFNQGVFFLAGVIIFLGVSSMVRTNSMMERAGTAILIAAGLNIAVALIDTITFSIGAPQLLDFVRNGDYAQLFSHTYMGIKRVTGTFPEASAFAGTAVALFAFSFRLWRVGVRSRVTGPLALGTLIALLFAFSSTGYATMLAYLGLAYGAVTIGADRRSVASSGFRLNQSVFLSFAPILALVAAIIIATNPQLLDPITETFDNSLASKLQSSSGVERSSWNTAGIRVFFDTYGLGAGVGSVRTSSFFVAVLANLGLIGVALFGLFFWKLFRAHPEKTSQLASDESIQYAAAARAGCFASLIAGGVSSSGVDLGILFYVMAGMACASLFYRKIRVPHAHSEIPIVKPGAALPSL